MNNLIFYLIGRVASVFGNGLIRIAIPIFILEKTASSPILANFIALATSPSLILSPIFGNYLENINKKYVMFFSDLLKGILFLVLFLLKTDNIFILGFFMCILFL